MMVYEGYIYLMLKLALEGICLTQSYYNASVDNLCIVKIKYSETDINILETIRKFNGTLYC